MHCTWCVLVLTTLHVGILSIEHGMSITNKPLLLQCLRMRSACSTEMEREQSWQGNWVLSCVLWDTSPRRQNLRTWWTRWTQKVFTTNLFDELCILKIVWNLDIIDNHERYYERCIIRFIYKFLCTCRYFVN